MREAAPSLSQGESLFCQRRRRRRPRGFVVPAVLAFASLLSTQRPGTLCAAAFSTHGVPWKSSRLQNGGTEAADALGRVSFVKDGARGRMWGSTSVPVKASAVEEGASASGSYTKETLRKKTVKELREIAKMSHGSAYSPSKVRLKSDLIDFLVERQAVASVISKKGTATPSNKSSRRAPNRNRTKPTTTKPRTAVRSMPTYRPESKMQQDPSKQDSPISLKETLIQELYERYPPLVHLAQQYGGGKSFASFSPSANHTNTNPVQQEGRPYTVSGSTSSVTPANDNNVAVTSAGAFYTGIDNDDIRATYHPMLRSNDTKMSSDLELVFVGTASCVPGTTRGVSCTALKLGWRRNMKGGKKDQVPRTGRANGETKVSGAVQGFQEDVFYGGTWLFDCGEGTQIQMQRTAFVKTGRVSKIFVTHAHGDHSFGLPGLLCLMGKDRPWDAPPIEIYGPEGLRMWLRACIRYSVSRIVPNYVVHELKDVPMAPEWKFVWQNLARKDGAAGGAGRGRYYYDESLITERSDGTRVRRRPWAPRGVAGEDPSSWTTQCENLQLERDNAFGEIADGRDIYPTLEHPNCAGGAPIWEVEEEEDVTVHAAPMSHGIPCVGYVVTEKNKPGRLRPDLVLPVVKRNSDALRERGFKNPMKLMALVKNLPIGSSYTFPDGTVIHQSDVVEPPRQGRKVVICGDTVDASAIEGLAQGADVLVHEATNAFLSGFDVGASGESVEMDTRKHGHSTPGMAGQFAKRIGAKRLVLNHFSPRYGGDQSLESIMTMTRIEKEAIEASGLPEASVAAAWDFMRLPVSNGG